MTAQSGLYETERWMFAYYHHQGLLRQLQREVRT